MYISRLEVKGQKDPVEIKKKKNILIIGPNGVGKSTFLWKLENLINPHENFCLISDVPRSKIKPELVTNYLRMNSVIYKDKDGKERIDLDLKKHPKIQTFCEQFNTMHYYPNKVNNMVLKLTQNVIRNKKDPEWLKKNINPVLYKKQSIKAIFHTREDNDAPSETTYCELMLKGVDGKTNKKLESHSNKNFLSFSFGQISHMEFIILLEANRNDSEKIILWDEPESHLHPESQQRIIILINQNPCQFIVASHSPFILKQTLLMKDKWVVLNMKRDEKGIELKQFQNLDKNEKIEVLNTYGIKRNFIFVEGEIDKDYFNVYFKKDPLYSVVSMSGGDNLMDKGARAAVVNFIEKQTLEEDVRVAMVLDADKNIPKNRKRLKKGNIKCFWIGNDSNKKYKNNIEGFILSALKEEVKRKVRKKNLHVEHKKRELCNFLIKEYPEEIEECLKSKFKEIEEYFNSSNSK